MVQVSHVSNKPENVDIYNPISSGFIHMKTLNKKNLALYTYYSDIHFSNRLSFNLKILKGKPEMYLYTCEEFPNCYNHISKLKSGNKNVVKPELKIINIIIHFIMKIKKKIYLLMGQSKNYYMFIVQKNQVMNYANLKF